MTRAISYSLALFVAIGVGLATGCSSASKSATPDAQVLSGADETIFIGDTIEKNYDPNVIMKRAEVFFEKEDYPEAIIEYQHFLDLHRTHVLAPYAQFKLGESHYKMFKTVDRDPSPINQALEAYQKLLQAFPGSSYEGQASEKIVACHDLLAQIHLLIGKFYYRRDAYLAAAYRFEAILKDYPDRPIVAEALYHLAKTYDDLGADGWAHEQLVALAERYPDHHYTKETKSWLARLNRDHPPRFVAVGDKTGIRQIAASAPSLHGHLSPNGQAGSTRQAAAIGQAGLNSGVASNGPAPESTGYSPVLLGQPRTAAVSSVSSPHPSSNGTSATGAGSPTITFCRLGVWC